MVTLALLFEVFESRPLLDTLAVLGTEPAAVGVTAIVIVAVAPWLIVPRVQDTVPEEFEHEPWDGCAEPKVTPLGNVSVTFTAYAGSELGPGASMSS